MSIKNGRKRGLDTLGLCFNFDGTLSHGHGSCLLPWSNSQVPHTLITPRLCLSFPFLQALPIPICRYHFSFVSSADCHLVQQQQQRIYCSRAQFLMSIREVFCILYDLYYGIDNIEWLWDILFRIVKCFEDLNTKEDKSSLFSHNENDLFNE